MAFRPGFDLDRNGDMDGHPLLHRVDHSPDVAADRRNRKALKGHDEPLAGDQTSEGKIRLALMSEEPVEKMVSFKRAKELNPRQMTQGRPKCPLQHRGYRLSFPERDTN